ncbi:DUF2087 domain-containing protein [Streptococcus suis]|uniref:DUF2087 domain-containing protein n=1 Tax=Streptococcus suis TaxID=1307 RepID=UPI00346441DA
MCHGIKILRELVNRKRFQSRQDFGAFSIYLVIGRLLTVNAFLAGIYDDYAILRRYMVDYGYLSRDQYGLEYRIEEKR